MDTTQFQMEGKHMVQGVTKLITIFFSFCDLKLKKLPIRFGGKMGLIHHFREMKGLVIKIPKKQIEMSGKI